jgi:glycosyltransferase involved in cell wall biosynthesis
MVSAFGVSAANVAVLGNPVDLDATVARAADPLEEAGVTDGPGPLLVGIGRLVEWKAYHVAVKALAHMRSFPQARMVVLGSGPEMDALRKLAAEHGVEGRVVFPGSVANPWKYLARADVFVHPSRSEAQGLVFVEAMALGVPVVSTSESAGIRESLDDGRCGLLVPFGDPVALAEAVSSVLTDEDLRQGLVARGRARAAQFALPAAVERYERAIAG